jgi:hypothetical protein
LIDAHLDDATWNQQTLNLDKIVQWAADRNARLIVLLWPQIAAVKDSLPALERAKGYFEGKGVQVVDMSAVLIDKDPLQMIVNRFDAHPGVPAQHLAADQLYSAIMQPAS